MQYDAFSAGVQPGGLRDKNEIKLLICYMLSSISPGLTKDDIIRVLQENALANYFDIADAFSDLLENGHILPTADGQRFTAADTGKTIAKNLDVVLPLSVRERALAATLNLQAAERLENENQVRIKKNEHGYTVDCNISGGDFNLLSFQLYAPDMLQAKMIKRNFHTDPARFYRCILALATENKKLTVELLHELLEKD
jgi:hypothetical protein